MVRWKTIGWSVALAMVVMTMAGCSREPAEDPGISQRVWQLSSEDPMVVQAAVDFLLSQDQKLVVPSLMTRVSEMKLLAVPRVMIQDVRKPAKPLKIYHPKKTCDLIALLLSIKTGQSFGNIYDGATDANRLKTIGSWQNWWNANKQRYR